MTNQLEQVSNEKANAGLMIDLENLHYSAYQFYKDRQFTLSMLLNHLNQRFNLILKKAYACSFDDSMQPYIHDCMINGIELVNCLPTRMHDTRKKNSIDIRMAVDVVSRVHTDPNINIYIIASGDGDFVPVISHVRQFANKVIIVGFKESTSVVLIANCDEFIELDSLLEQAPRGNPRQQYRQERPDRDQHRRDNSRYSQPKPRSYHLSKEEIRSAFESTLDALKDQLVFGLNVSDFREELLRIQPNIESLLNHRPIDSLIKTNLHTVRMKDENGDLYLYLNVPEPVSSPQVIDIVSPEPIKRKKTYKKRQTEQAQGIQQPIQKAIIGSGGSWFTSFWDCLPAKKERIRFFNLVFNNVFNHNVLEVSNLKKSIIESKYKKIKATQLQLYESLFYTRALVVTPTNVLMRDWVRDIISLDEHFVAFWIVYFKLSAGNEFSLDVVTDKLEQTAGISPMQKAALLEPNIFLLRLGLRTIDELMSETVSIL